MTVKSKLDHQISNDHWKERAEERGKYNLDDPFVLSQILRELKETMKNPDNIQPSKQSKDRFLVSGKDGLHYVLLRHKPRKGGKDIYVPVTVLAPKMKY